jgi:hypothetical protein
MELDGPLLDAYEDRLALLHVGQVITAPGLTSAESFAPSIQLKQLLASEQPDTSTGRFTADFALRPPTHHPEMTATLRIQGQADARDLSESVRLAVVMDDPRSGQIIVRLGKISQPLTDEQGVAIDSGIDPQCLENNDSNTAQIGDLIQEAHELYFSNVTN